MSQCDGKPLALTEGPQLQGIALLNIPSTHGGTNMWGDSTVKTRQQRKKAKRGDDEQGEGAPVGEAAAPKADPRATMRDGLTALLAAIASLEGALRALRRSGVDLSSGAAGELVEDLGMSDRRVTLGFDDFLLLHDAA